MHAYMYFTFSNVGVIPLYFFSGDNPVHVCGFGIDTHIGIWQGLTNCCHLFIQITKTIIPLQGSVVNIIMQ